MITVSNPNQATFAGFGWPFHCAFDESNRWVKLRQCIPWELLAQSYNKTLSPDTGRPAKEAQLVIGAVIIKHKLGLSDRETVAQIQEGPYLQYFVGFKDFQTEPPFAPSLLVEIRKRMGDAVFEDFHQAIIGAVEDIESESSNHDGDGGSVSGGESAEIRTAREAKPSKDETKQNPSLVEGSESRPADTPSHQGKLIVDATVADQAIRYPTDLSLLNEAREFTEQIIDQLYPASNLTAKPRTYRQNARKAFLGLVKQRRAKRKALCRAIKAQLQYLRRNLGHIERLMDCWPMGSELPLPHWLLYRYWVIQHLYEQQWQMHQSGSRRCDDRIVSISQPYVRPIVRGKLNKPVEFGAKLSVSLNGKGLARVDRLSFDAFNEGGDLKQQVEQYRERYGCYPEKVLADPLYGSRENRSYLREKGIHYAGKPLGRPKKVTPGNKEELKMLKVQRREDYRQRIPIEGKFGQGKSAYGLSYIRAKRADTSAAWINSIFLVMNLLILLEVFFVPKLCAMVCMIMRNVIVMSSNIRNLIYWPTKTPLRA